jgi:hypothetical protein
MKTDNAKIFEHWYSAGDSALYGSSYRVTADGDSILLEHLEIKYIHDTLCYIPTVLDQNHNEPVIFKLTSLSNQSAVFENPTHDFPQRIEYYFLNKNEMKTTVSGSFQGQMPTLKFHYKRVR